MRQPIHALSMLNDCLSDAITTHVERAGAAKSQELVSCITDSSHMKGVLKHLMSLADDFLVFSSLNPSASFSLNLARAKLSKICKRVEMVSGALAKEKGSAFTVTCGEELLDGLSVYIFIFISILLILPRLFPAKAFII
jgi:hypothetical protein